MIPILKRLSIYLIIFVVSFGILFNITDIWQSLDYYVYRTFYLENAEKIDLRDDILLIDLPYLADSKSSFDRGNYRKRLSDLLDTIGTRYDDEKGDRPTVILDIYFTSDPAELTTLKNAVKRLKDRGIKVYAVYNTDDYKTKTFEANEVIQAKELYQDYFDGSRLHTMFETGMGIITYMSEIKLKKEGGGYELIESLVQRVALDYFKSKDLPTSKGYVLPLGTEGEINSQTYRFTHQADKTSEGRFSADFDMSDKFFIVGSLKHDEFEIEGTMKKGPHLVAWALNDQLKNNQIAKQPLNHPLVILGQILFFSFFTVLIFALIFKYVKRLQTKPLLVSFLSLIIATAFLIGAGAAILTLGKIMPAGLTLVGMALAAILAWRFAHKFLVTGIVEGSQKYDVFISYSRQHSDWVVKNVYEPLKTLRKSDGDKISIFFDRDSIGIGEAFTSKYMWAIVDSRFFIPIFSEDYYRKNHCRNEVDLAYKRSVENMITILPIAHSYEAVPRIYNHINFIDVTADPNFIEGIKEKIIDADNQGEGGSNGIRG